MFTCWLTSYKFLFGVLHWTIKQPAAYPTPDVAGAAVSRCTLQIMKDLDLWIPLSPAGQEITPRGEVHPSHPQPMAFMRKRKHLLSLVHAFPLWNSACRLIKPSLTGKTHSTQKINTHLFVFFIFSLPARLCVLMECLSLLWRKMMRSIILQSPGRYKFLFPWGIPVFYKNIDQEFTVSCKGPCMCGSCCHHGHIPTAETYK